MNVQVLSVGGPKIGPMGCAKSFSELQVPPIGAGSSTGLELNAFSLAPEEIKTAMRAKNVGLGTAIGVFFSLALALLIGGVVSLRRLRAAPAGSARELEAAPEVPAARGAPGTLLGAASAGAAGGKDQKDSAKDGGRETGDVELAAATVGAAELQHE